MRCGTKIDHHGVYPVDVIHQTKTDDIITRPARAALRQVLSECGLVTVVVEGAPGADAPDDAHGNPGGPNWLSGGRCGELRVNGVRDAFHEQLDALSTTLGQMCGLAGAAMERATQALLFADVALAEQVLTDHEQLVQMRSKYEDEVFVLLALQAPVAGDLRAALGALQNVADVERMGALALHIAKIARRRHPGRALPDEVMESFAEMGRVAVELGESARQAVLTGNPYEAAQIRHKDDAMDDLHRHLFTVLTDEQWRHGVAAAVDITLLGRFYERFADHAVEIGRRVVFQVTGRHRAE